MDDMVWRPALRDLDAERQVVLEEIAMYLDDPQDRVFDVLGEAVFGSHPLGRAIIGRPEVIARTPPEEIATFHHARYTPTNVVVAAAGSIEHDEVLELARRFETERRPPYHSPADVPDDVAPRRRFERKDTEQYHVCLGGPGIPRDDERRFALRVLDTILGGSSSSRLFQEVREKRGLAYSVYTFSSQYAGIGQVGLYVGTRSENVSRAMEVVGSELERLREEPVTADELERAKENAKGRLVLSLESTTTRMNRLGSAVLTGVPVLTVDQMIDRIDAVDLDDLHELAGELYAPERLSAAGIGADEDVFRAALEHVTPALA
jgi:predicted Zn-dependent peptidase